MLLLKIKWAFPRKYKLVNNNMNWQRIDDQDQAVFCVIAALNLLIATSVSW